MLKSSSILVSLAIFAGSTVAAHAGDLPKSKQTKLGLYVTAEEAKDMMANENVLFIDVRSRAEVAFLGIVC